MVDRSRRCRRPAPADGYTLLVLVVFVTVMSIVVAAAMPRWSVVVQREKEEELIFRGLQYAEAIRIFQTRFGRFPVRLEELVEVNPRCIRQLWKDPMSETGQWGVLYVEADLGAGQPGLDDDDDDEPDEAGRSSRRESRRRSSRRPPSRRERREQEQNRQAGESRTGPIIGVRSLVAKDALIQFAGGSKYSEWRFTPEILALPSAVVGENIPNLNSRWIGRPLPGGIEPQDGDLPGQAGEQPADTRRRSRPSRRSSGRRSG